MKKYSNMSKKTKIIILLTGCLLCSATLQAAVRYVKPGGSAAGQARQATSWAAACADLQAVVSASSAGDSVFVATGSYSGGFTMKEGVQVFGGFKASAPEVQLTARKPMENKSILDGGGAQRVLSQTADFATPTVWDGFVLQNGKAQSPTTSSYSLGQLNEMADAGGGAMLLRNGVLRNCHVVNNTAFSKGGGVYTDLGAQVLGCLIESNTAPAAPGVYLAGAGSLMLSCTVVKNRQVNPPAPALPAIGQCYYADGSWSSSPVAGKTLVGIICGVNASNPYSGTVLHTQEATAKTWAEANTSASSLTTAGLAWRQPTADELVAIYANKAALNAALTAASGTALGSSDYWSATEVGAASAWRINLGTGGTQPLSKSSPVNARAVTGF